MSEASQLDRLLDQYEEAMARGIQVDLELLCRDTPELFDALKERVDAMEEMTLYVNNAATETSSEIEEDTLPINSELTDLQFHDKGGLGVVFRAKEANINREVAVKFIHRNLIHHAESRSRFELEAEVTGRLEHPGVVPLYGMGQSQSGRLFYYMRFIDGCSMDRAIRDFHDDRPTRGQFVQQSVEFRRLLTSFVSVCKTIAYAHSRGIVHRDIKPANIMLGKYGETLVVDWGLATPVDRDPRFTVNGEVTLRPKSGSSNASTGSGAGTAAYMSPEQASELAPTPASDIYSLGATLYKMLTGIPSVCGDCVTEMKQTIISGQIVRPRDRLASIPAPLEAICLKAMALQPSHRYDTALALADDVENYLADSEVSAFREPITRRMARLARKHRFAAQTAVVSLVAILAITGIAAAWLASLAHSEKLALEEAQRQESLAITAQETAEEARKDNLITSASFLADAIANQIDNRWRIMESARSSPELIRTVKALNDQPDDLEAREALQRWLVDCKQARDVFANQDSIWVIFSREGTLQARVPQNRVIGRSYSHRDYFHGYGRDLTDDDVVSALKPIAEIGPHEFLLPKLGDHQRLHSAHLSNVFLSTATGHLQVTFTVPIWDRPVEDLEKQTIGIFAISLEIQNLPLPDNAMLVQVRPDQLTGDPGLVISHRQLKPHTDQDLPPRVPSIVELAPQLERHRFRERRQGVRAGALPVSPFLADFVDPVAMSLGQEAEPTLAAFEPVIVHTRPDVIAKTGWTVVVTEQSE